MFAIIIAVVFFNSVVLMSLAQQRAGHNSRNRYRFVIALRGYLIEISDLVGKMVSIGVNHPIFSGLLNNSFFVWLEEGENDHHHSTTRVFRHDQSDRPEIDGDLADSWSPSRVHYGTTLHLLF